MYRFIVNFRRKKKLLRSVIIIFCITGIAFVLIFAATIDDNTIQPEGKNLKYKDNPEIAKILRNTPYLWRKFDLSENDTSRSRIYAQQKWVRQLSGSKHFAENSDIKVIWLEDDPSLFYWTEGRIQCPYAPNFENKCQLKQLPLIRRFLGPFRYNGMDGDAIISVRNWDSRYSFKTPKNMLQIMCILEPPLIAKSADLGFNNALLASYWRGSDIPTPYTVFVQNSARNASERNFELGKAVTKIKSKKKMVAAIISNCKSSERLDYIQELQKYVRVDVYGKCGNFSCPKSQNNDCLRMIEDDYKFFLSFENSRCEDYITEKLFENALSFYIVPVVRGSRPSSYIDVAPTHSYIHVDDYGSPEKVANYLKYLDGNQEAYLKYFQWKGTGYFSAEHFQDFFCRACAMLFYSDFVPPPRWDSNNVKWSDVNYCLPPSAPGWPK